MAQQVMEGTWEEISRCADQWAGRRVRLIVLTPENDDESTLDTNAAPASAMITFGMFPQLRELTEADFEAAEFHGDPDDGLDWS